MSSKDIRKALIIARGLASRPRKQIGGGLSSPPLLGAPATEFVSNEQGHQNRGWIPGEIHGDNLPAVVNGQPSSVVKQEKVSPIYRSLTHDALADPNSLGGMKAGNPQQWANALTKAGAKKEELDWLGVNEGNPGTKVSRDDMLARAKARLPNMYEKLMGDKIKEKVLLSGDPDEEDDPYENVSVYKGGWEHEEPDRDSIWERAKEHLDEELPGLLEDPHSDAVKEHLPDALEKFAGQWLTANPDGNRRDSIIDPNTMDRSRVYDFMRTAVENGWAHPGHAEAVLKSQRNGNIDHGDWNKFVDNTMEGFANKFGETDEDTHPKLFPMEDKPEASTSEDFMQPLSNAVTRLHGFNLTQALPMTGGLRYVPGSAIKHRGYPGYQELPDAHKTLEDHMEDKLQDKYFDQEMDWAREDPDTPRLASWTVNGDGPDAPDYDIRDESGYGNGYIISHNGRHIGETDSEDEAQSLVLSHALDNYSIGRDGGPQYEERDIPQDNMTVPLAQGSPRFEDKALPGITNYREHTLHFDPKGSTFTRGHFDPNAVVHMRYGDARDTNGKRMLYLDEIQSDWHQKGRDEGYLTGDAAQKKAEAAAAKPKAEENYQDAAQKLSSGLDISLNHHAVEKLAALLLLDPNTPIADRPLEERNAISRTVGQFSHQTNETLFGFTHYTPNLDESMKHFHNYAREHLGDDYKTKVLALNDAKQKLVDINEAMRGNNIPDAPWKDSSDWAKLAIKRAMRTAADYNYDGVALSPGWVQSHRWGGNEGHMGLYDKTFAGSLDKVAKEVGAKAEKAHIPLLAEHARRHEIRTPGAADVGEANAVYLTPDVKQKIRKEGFKLFKRGGLVRGRANGGSVNHNPTDAQKEAGNYKKEHRSFHGLKITIENKKGSTRRGIDGTGKRWKCKLPADYGYIKRTKRADGGPVDPPQLNNLGMYSQAAQAAKALPQNKGTPQQMIASLKGVKPDELKWSGVNDAFAGQPSVTKDQLAQHFQDALPSVEDHVLGGRQSNQEAQFGAHTLPGGENYREVLLSLPTGMQAYNSFTKALRNKYGEGGFDNLPLTSEERTHLDNLVNHGEDIPFQDSHFPDTPNLLAHLRMSDRRLSDTGDKALHLEELQSGWGQRGRKEGFAQPDESLSATKMPEGHFEVRGGNNRFVTNVMPHDASDEQSAIDVAHHRMAVGDPSHVRTGIPTAPYVTTTNGWTDLGLKRALLEAARGGYKKLVWTPGDEQAKRYDLSKQIDRVILHDNNSGGAGRPQMDGPFKSGTLEAFDHAGNKVIDTNVYSPEHLAEVIGKEAADKMLKAQPQEVRYAGLGLRERRLNNADLKVGGEGMKGYYDNIMPKRLIALAKEHDPDAKIGADKIYTYKPKSFEDFAAQHMRIWPETPQDQMQSVYENYVRGTKMDLPSLDITPKMRASILKNGFKAYRRGGAAKAVGGPLQSNPIVGQALKVAQKYLAHRPGSLYKPTM